MKNLMRYKNYTGSIEYSEEDDILFWKILDIQPLLLYEGKTFEELKNDFYDTIDMYLECCNQENIKQETAIK